MRVALLLLLAACWTSSSPRATTPVAASQPTTPAPAYPPATEEPAPASEPGATALTTRRWKYASFFTRLKRDIAQAWRPDELWNRLPRVQRDAYGTQTRTTLLELEVAGDGRLVGVRVVQSSGAPELDAEAIHSAQAASPFAMPPPELLPLTFKFGFTFEVTAQSGSTKVVP